MRSLATVIVLAGVAACSGAPGPPTPQARVNILLITLDTVRADRLGQGFTPTLDGLAAQGLRFVAARSVAPLTLPAHASILTGQLPPVHGVRLNGAARLNGVTTLAAHLKGAGYQTRAVVGAFVLDRRFGLDTGFDDYDDRIARDPAATDTLQAERPANAVVEGAIAQLSATADTSPWLMWVHLYDAHAPYLPPAAARARAGGDGYNGEIAFVDSEVARLLAAVGARPDAARTAVMVVGDHGESLTEHGEPTHGMLVFEPSLRVPLMVRAPGVASAERHDPASLIDVLPTALSLAGVPLPALPGRSLLGQPSVDIESYAESEYPRLAGWAPTRALIRDRWKLVMADRPVLFDLAADPGEQHDVSPAQPSLARAMSARLDAIRDTAVERATAATPAAVPAETASRLRSLGYLAPSAAPPVRGATGEVNPATAIGAWAKFEAALAEVNAGRATPALPALKAVAAQYPDSAIFEAAYARALASTGRSSEALTRFRRAVTRWPADWSLYHELAVVARDAGLAGEAMRAEEAALVLAPQEPSVLNGKGLLLADAGRHGDAARAFEAATTGDPTNAVYHANLGNARRAGGDLEGAAAAYRRALDRAPDLADAANGLGVVLVQQNRPADAVRWLELAARDATFIEAQLNLGIALQQAGDGARARIQYQKIVSASGPHVRERQAARALLAQLEKP